MDVAPDHQKGTVGSRASDTGVLALSIDIVN
jgi:hypothetical protein